MVVSIAFTADVQYLKQCFPALLTRCTSSYVFSVTQEFYGLTLDALKEAKNDRLWFKTQLKLCGLWFKLKEYGRGAKILRELHRYPRRLCPGQISAAGPTNPDRLAAQQLDCACTPRQPA